MTTVRHIRTSAGRLDGARETVESTGFSWRVGDQPFAWVDTKAATLRIAVSAAEAARIVADMPAAQKVQRPTGVSVALADLNGMAANAILHRAWSRARPQGSPEPADVVDLPASIGRPATRALTAHGIGSLSELAQRDRDEIAELHGIGPKAIGILAEALADRGVTWP